MSATAAKDIVFVVARAEALRKQLLEVLGAEDLAARGFASTDEFMSAFDPDAHGCLLLELGRAGASGLELQRWLAARRARMPIVFLTASCNVPTVVAAMRGGAIDILEVPFDRNQLIRAVHAALAFQHMSREAEARSAENRRKLSLLTKRELEICDILVKGVGTKEVARKLGLSARTIEHHRESIRRKFEAPSAVDLARMYFLMRHSDSTHRT